jgi:RimJ/RimL family protein N-acetyltransferase
MAEAWLATSSLWRSYVMEAVIWTRDVLEWLQTEFHLRRLQADVQTANKIACRFVEHFGFVAEGVMRAYDVLGQDTTRYARIREEINGKPR